MYKILHNGDYIAIVDEPRYVRMHTNGCWVQTDEENAEGIAVLGTVYPIAKTSVIKCTEAEYAFEQTKAVEKTNADVAYIAMMTDVEIPDSEEEKFNE